MRPATDRVEESAHADIIVIGGGFTGLSATLNLAREGFRVWLLEARRIGWGASGRNGGQIIPGFRKGPAELIRLVGLEDARKLTELAVAARQLLWDTAERERIACSLVSTGHLTCAARPRHFAEMRADVDAAAQLGYDHLQLVEADALDEHVAASGYVGGLLDKLGGHFHPLNYLVGLAGAAVRAGARISDRTRVNTIFSGDGGGVRVLTNRGEVTANYAIVACDALIEGLEPALDRRLMPVYNYIVTTQKIGQERAAALIPSNVAVSDSKFVLNYFRLTPDDRLMFSGGESYSMKPRAQIKPFVRPHLDRVFPQLTNVRLEYAWGGVVGVTTSRFPHIGRRGPLFFAHGYSGLGCLWANFCGKVLADAITGDEAAFDLLARLPGGEWPGGRMLRHPLYTLGMIWYALRDRIG